MNECFITIKDIENSNTASELLLLVDRTADLHGTKLHDHQSWAENAVDLGDEHPLYDTLLAAEKRWYELEA